MILAVVGLVYSSQSTYSSHVHMHVHFRSCEISSYLRRVGETDGAMLARCAGRATPLLMRSSRLPVLRRGASDGPPTQLASSDRVSAWMADESLVSPQGFFGRPRMWLMLRALPGLDLPDFLAGSRLAYSAVVQLMYAKDWDTLAPLVSEPMLKAMQGTMDEFADAGRRIVDVEEGSIDVQTAVLREVHVLEDQTGLPEGARRCHLDVHLVSHETWRIFDYHTNEAIEPYDGRVRVQESTWRFEGVVAEPQASAGDAPAGSAAAAASSGDGDEGDARSHAQTDWTVFAVVG